MLSKSVFGYFQKWKLVNSQYKYYLITKLNDRIIRYYKSYMTSYFVNWKALKDQKLIRKRGKIVHEMECQYDEMHKDAIINDKKIRDELTALKTS